MRELAMVGCGCLLAAAALGWHSPAARAADGSVPVIAVAQTPVAPPQSDAAKPIEAELANGLRLLVVEDHRTTKVVFQLHMAGAGSYYDPADAIGLAAATADVAQRATATLAYDDLVDQYREWDAVISVLSPPGSTVTVVGGNGPSRVWRQLLELTAGFARAPQFPGESIDATRKDSAEMLVKIRSMPRFAATNLFARVLYGRHPAAVADPLASPAVPSFTAAQMAAFAKAHYVPDHAVLAVAGDVAFVDVKKAVEELFGDWKKAGTKLTPVAKPSEPTAGVSIVDLDVPYVRLIVGTLAVNRAHPDFDALEVLSRVLATDKQGRLPTALGSMIAPDLGRTDPAESTLAPQSFGGTWRTEGAYQLDATANVLKIINTQLTALRTDLISPEELAAARKGAIDRYLASRENLQTRLSSAVGSHVFKLPPDYWDKRQEHLNAVTAEQVRTVARKYLDPKRLVTAIAGPRAKVEPQLKGLGPVTVVRPDGSALSQQ